MYMCVLQEDDTAAYQGLPSAQFFASPRGLCQVVSVYIQYK